MASMSQNIVDLVGIFVDAMRTTETIISEVDNGDGSITITSNVTVIENGDYIILGTENYLVYDLDKIAGTFKVNATFPTGETTWRTAAPYYYHGTPQTVNKEIDTDNVPTDKARYPAIVLWEIIRQDFDKDPVSVVGNTARLTMSFLDTTNKIDWTIEEHYDNVIDKMEDEADRFISIIKKHPYISRFDDYSYIKHFNWGTFVQDKGHTRYILDENLSGLNLEIALPIKKNCLNKYARLTPSNVPPLPTADGTYKNSDSSFIRLIAGGDTFTAPDVSITDSDGTIIPTPANKDFICTPATDGIYKNSDSSFVQAIAGGSTYTAPDITITDSDGTLIAVPSNKDFVCTAGGSVSGILYNRPVYSGWRTSFANYDEAWQKANGTYDYTKIDPEFIARLDFSVTNSFFTLTENNSFGNLARFTDENGYYYTDPFDSGSATDPSAFASDYIIDHLTGLGWRRTKISGNWATLLSDAESQTFATFSDWRIPTIYEMFSVVCCDVDPLGGGSRRTGLEWYPYNQRNALEYNSATTNAQTTSECYTYFAGVIASLSINLNRNPKTLVAPAFTVRNHFT